MKKIKACCHAGPDFNGRHETQWVREWTNFCPHCGKKLELVDVSVWCPHIRLTAVCEGSSQEWWAYVVPGREEGFPIKIDTKYCEICGKQRPEGT
jgi:hypothetical protein